MHRLFHTLVVCGAGLTLAHCGGKSSTDADDDGADDSGGSAGSGSSSGGVKPGSGTGGSSTADGGKAAGGSTSPGGRGGAGGSVGAGGVSTGGVSTGGVGGTNAMGGMGGLAPTGPTERWTCTIEGCFGALTGPAGCTVDPDRPEGPSDCEDGELFACVAAWLSDGSEVRVNCECVPLPPDDEPCPCPSTTGTSCAAEPPFEREACAAGESVCSCALTCILK